MAKKGRTVHKFRQTMQDVREAADGALPGAGAGGGHRIPFYMVCFVPCQSLGVLILNHICMPPVPCIHVYTFKNINTLYRVELFVAAHASATAGTNWPPAGTTPARSLRLLGPHPLVFPILFTLLVLVTLTPSCSCNSHSHL